MSNDTFYIDNHKYYGRPVRSMGPDAMANPIDRIPAELACYDLLDSLGILYSRVDHSHADTIEACADVERVLGLMNDKENKVQLVMDKPIHEAENIACHPCISTSTLCFSMEDLLKKLLPAMHHEPIIVDLVVPEEE